MKQEKKKLLKIDKLFRDKQTDKANYALSFKNLQ